MPIKFVWGGFMKNIEVRLIVEINGEEVLFDSLSTEKKQEISDRLYRRIVEEFICRKGI